MSEVVRGVVAPSATLNVSRMINEGNLSSLQVRVIALCAAVILLDGFDSLAIGLAGPQIATSLHIPLSSLGVVFGIGQAGLLIGAVVFGMVADRVGRKWLVVLATTIFGALTLATAFAGSYEQLLAFRFLAGLGLGGATPNVVALTSEYAPKRIRSGTVTLVWAALPLGGVAVGFAAATLMPTRGWESVFYIGGILPLIIAVMLAAWLPESMTFLVTRDWKLDKVAEIVKTIDPRVIATANTKFATDEVKLAGAPVKHLFIEKRAIVTLLLWVGFFCSFLVLVFVSSWIPSLLRAAGLSMSQAGAAIALNSIGSAIGSSIVGRLMDRFGRYLVLLLAFFTAAVTTGALGFAASSFGAVAVAIALSGCFAGASQSGVIALAAVTYPVAVRSTALGWAIAVGRLGAVVAPLLGGLFVARAWPVQDILVAIACSSVVGGLAVLLLRSVAARQPDLSITATAATP